MLSPCSQPCRSAPHRQPRAIELLAHPHPAPEATGLAWLDGLPTDGRARHRRWGSVAPTAAASVPAAVHAANEVSAEEAAKQAWLARLDAPTWGQAAAAVAGASTTSVTAELVAQCDGGDEEACETLTREEAAKRAWLAKLDAPTWGAVAAGVSEVAAATSVASAGKMTEDEAKKRWLERLDAPTWGQAANALLEVAGAAAVTADLAEKCESGEDAACDLLTREEEAKQAWLARLDAPTWGAVTAAVTAVSSAVQSSSQGAMSAEQVAKAAWLAKLDQEPSWKK